MNIFLFNRKCLPGTSWNDRFELHDPVGPCPALSGPVGSVPFGPLGPPLWRPLAELNFCRSNVGSAWRDKTTATGSSCKGTWRRGDTRLAKETDGRPMGDPWNLCGTHFHCRNDLEVSGAQPGQKWQDPQYVICTTIGRQQKMNKIIICIHMPYANRSQASMCFHISTHSLASAGLKTESPGMQRREPQGRSLVETKVSPEEPPLRFCWGPGWAWYVAVPLDQKVLCSQAGLSHLVFFWGRYSHLFCSVEPAPFNNFQPQSPQHKRLQNKTM